MGYDVSDSSGTDDDLPPSHQNRVHRGPRLGGNGRSAVVASVPYPSLQTDMENQIYHLEQEAYRSVLLAFKAQSDTTITWEKTNLMAELRKELHISEDEHKALLGRVDADDNLRRIREWRQSGGLQPGLQSTSHPVHDPLPSPTFSASRKKQKISQSVASLGFHQTQTVVPSLQRSLSTTKRGVLPGSKSNNPKPNQVMKPIQYPSTIPSGRGQVYDPSLIGRKVRTRWPADNNFYEAVITDYKEGLYALVYDSKTQDESFEWVNFNDISPEDIIWEGEEPGISRQGSLVGKKSMSQNDEVAGIGRGRGSSQNLHKRDFPPVQNGVTKKMGSDDIEILRTDVLIKEVEKMIEASQLDPLKIQKAKKALKEHEQALVDAISRLSNKYDANAGKHTTEYEDDEMAANDDEEL